jgi:SAM-dependent methyltransferase
MKFVSLGEHYVSDFVKSEDDTSKRKKYSLDIWSDDKLGAARLHDLASPDSMWGQYWYRSGINTSMKAELYRIVNEILPRVKPEKDDIWLDIACNDGTLLSYAPPYMKRIGIDPCDDSYFKESSNHGEIIQDYFSKDAWNKTTVKYKKAKIITCIAMFYDLDDPQPFVQSMYDILDDDGVVVLQMSYTPLMIKQMAFDNICHEHVYYYDLTSIIGLFSRIGFNCVDCSLNDTNGGSFRIYFRKLNANSAKFGSAPLRDVCETRIASILAYEQNIINIRKLSVWDNFERCLKKMKHELLDVINDVKASGKTIYGYGASTKGNTLLQYFGLNKSHITAIAERSPYKFGLKTIGTHIPIISEEEMRATKPDFLLVLPWHFIDDFLMRKDYYLNSGGRMIVPCPEVKIY